MFLLEIAHISLHKWYYTMGVARISLYCVMQIMNDTRLNREDTNILSIDPMVSNRWDYPEQPISSQMDSFALKKSKFWKSFHDTRCIESHFAQISYLSISNGWDYRKQRKIRKWFKIKTGPYGQLPFKIKILKIWLFHVLSWPKLGLEPKFHEAATSSVWD